jgi:hypothetical protein
VTTTNWYGAPSMCEPLASNPRASVRGYHIPGRRGFFRHAPDGTRALLTTIDTDRWGCYVIVTALAEGSEGSWMVLSGAHSMERRKHMPQPMKGRDVLIYEGKLA